MRTAAALLGLLLLGGAAAAMAQAPPPSVPPPMATPLPLSGRGQQAGSVVETSQPTPGTTSSVNTINPTVSVQGPYAGSTPAATAFNGQLSLRDAIQRGLAYNLGAVGVATVVRQAQGQSLVARSALLPNLNGNLSENVEQEDLKALGFRFTIPVPGFSFPTIVGPFNYMDLQASLTQSVADLTAIHNYRAARQTVAANQLAMRDARDLIVLGVGGAYLEVIAAKARLASAQAQLVTANAILKQSQEQKGVGALAQLNVDQNQVQQLLQQQQLTTLENDLGKQKINLARMTGLPVTDQYDITDSVPYAPAPALDVESAVRQALAQRADLQSAQTQVLAAQNALAAAKDERLPSASVAADYGVIGSSIVTGSHGVFSAVGSINIPLWQGGRVTGDIAQADAAVAQRQAEVADTRGAIEAQVRDAYLDLQAASAQVAVAQQNLKVVHEALDMTRLRFDAGVINTLELVQAQQSVATAEQDYINSVFAHNLAKLSLARALGNAETSLPQFLALPK